MRGGGTKLGITTHNPPPARLLDLTRLVSRAGRLPTGVDRVELAYLGHISVDATPAFGLVRTAFGYVLLDSAGMVQLAARLRGEVPWGSVDRLSRTARRLGDAQKRAQSDVRRLALARARPWRLWAMLARHLPQGVAYVNVGHSNLTDRVIRALRKGPKARIAVMIHDTIPLDYPEYQRPESVVRFRAMLRRAQGADVLIYNSDQTRQDSERHMAHWGVPPVGVVAHLGVDDERVGEIPTGIDPIAPYFVTLGTIEPRKNHAMLLDIWEEMAADPPDVMPHLYVVGHRGWQNEALFARMDHSPIMGKWVHELPDLPDGAVAALLQGAAGALFPSLAEGYGLPPIEAAALGVPVICNDLPVYREILGDIPVYASVLDRYLWRTTINDLTKDQRAEQQTNLTRKPLITRPNWKNHFNLVLKVT